MEEKRYEITARQIEDMIMFAMQHRKFYFHTEPLGDKEEFLSCIFNSEDDKYTQIWELDPVDEGK